MEAGEEVQPFAQLSQPEARISGGVGMASLVATAVFRPRSGIANTGEWLRRSTGVASAHREPRKRGPARSPDFVFEDAQRRFHLVEAKGTQGSLKALEGQLYEREPAGDGKVEGPTAALRGP